MRRVTCAAMMATLAIGCADANDPEIPEPPPGDQVDGDDQGEPGVGQLGVDAGGRYVYVNTPWGVDKRYYVLKDGWAITEGDIALGPAAQFQGTWATIQIDLGKRWPDGQVYYLIDQNNIPEGDALRGRIASAMSKIEAQTPLEFVEVCGKNPVCPSNYIVFQKWGQTYGLSTGIGMNGGMQNIMLPPTFTTGGIIHELGHAVGLWHEQSRPDRNSFVSINPACIKPDMLSQYNAQPGEAAYGDYDYASIMHYSSNGFRVDNPADAPCNGGWPMVNITNLCPSSICQDKNGDGFAEYISGQRKDLSNGDVNALWGMYAGDLSDHAAGDSFASNIVYGDFDNDGKRDLAVGAPGEDVGAIGGAGAVFLFKHTDDTFEPWMTITQSNLGSAVEANDALGSALAAGDFNGDGIDDLIIGAKGENNAAGAIFFMRGTSDGLVHAKTYTQGTIGSASEANDQFGATLETGDYNGDGIDDVAVAAIYEAHGAGFASGHVWVLEGTVGGNPTLFASLHQEMPAIGLGNGGGFQVIGPNLGTNGWLDQFGFSMASGDINGDGKDDLAIGTPCDKDSGTCDGAVYVYRGGATGMVGWQRWDQSALGGAIESYDRFGYSVAMGDLNGDGDIDLAVGAPYEDVGSTDDAGYLYLFRSNGTNLEPWDKLGQSGISDTSEDDFFGWSLEVGAFGWLYVGAPGEAVGGAAKAGGVFRFKPTVPGTAGFFRESPLGVEEAEDKVGRSLAVFRDDFEDFVVAGAPGEDASAGAAFIYRKTDDGIGGWGDLMILKQTSVGTRSNN